VFSHLPYQLAQEEKPESVTKIGNLRNETFKSPFEYSKNLLGTPNPVRGHTVADPCSVGHLVAIGADYLYGMKCK
jgi:hypothetical protein